MCFNENRGGTAGDGGLRVALLDKLQTTMDAIMTPVHPAFRMFLFAAFFNDDVRVYHFATAWAIPDQGIVAPVVQVRTPFPSHVGSFLSLRIDLPIEMAVPDNPGEFGKSNRLMVS